MSSESRRRIAVGRLVVGLYVDLGLAWNRHPFLVGKFLIKSQDQIDVIRSLEVDEVWVDFSRSLPGVQPEPEAAPPAEAASTPAVDALWEQKRNSTDKGGEYRQRHADRMQRYSQSARATKRLMRELDSQPANAVRTAGDLVEEMTAAFASDRDVIINLVSLQGDDQDMYHHALNVLVLSMLLGVAVGMDQAQLRELALGALLHDMGKVGVPARILMKTTRLSQPEQAIYEHHTRYGRDLAQRIGELPRTTVQIIHHHHELLDGSGYPDGLRDDEIERPVRIVALANLYDNLCNPPDVRGALIPKAALSVLFSQYKSKVDGELLALFIRSLGVYPPGTVVRLSDGTIGMVISVDSKELLKPEVLLYHPEIPREEAVIVDLRNEPDLRLEAALVPGQYPAEAFAYLGVRARAGYYFDSR